MKRKSFPAYYNTFFEKIYRYIFFRVGRKKELAEDLTSDIFLKAYEHYDTFDHEKSFSVWIYRIAHNHLIDHYKKSKKETVPVEDKEYELGEESKIEKEIDIKLDLEKVSKILDKIQEKQRELVIMKYFNDLTNREIAQVMSQTEEYIRVLNHRAIQAIKSHL
ncbi:RNA polymerase sigma factor [Pseudomonadota bacterium]